MPANIKLADYLFTRLRQLGIGSIHGVPGDYNLELLDYVEPNGLHWVGNANELNAGYAADGYSKINGMGALITTFGVGELSAINAIACAYAEKAAVVHIVGTPSRDSQDRRLNVHHTLGDGNYRHFAQMQSHITVAQVSLRDARTSVTQIDEVLRQSLLQSRPVYIEVPVDMVTALVPADPLNRPIEIPNSMPVDDEILRKLLDSISRATNPIILIDNEARGLRMLDEIESFVKLTQWPTFTSASAKGLIDMTLPNVRGIFSGQYADLSTKALFDDADLIACFGPHFSSTNSYNWTAVPTPAKSIHFTHDGIKIGEHHTYRDVTAKAALAGLLDRLSSSSESSGPTNCVNSRDKFPQSICDQTVLSFSDVSANSPLEHDNMWKLLATCLCEGDVVMGETGTAGYGVREMHLPRHARLFTPSTWLSIGYMLPAAQGVALALRESSSSRRVPHAKLNDGHTRHNDATKDSVNDNTTDPPRRTILFTGDGSFQMTCQELSTMIRHSLSVLVFLLNNDGYTIERAIHGPTQPYNDVGRWSYLKALEFFGAGNKATAKTRRVTDYGELQAVLEDPEIMEGEGVRMVELVMRWDDVPVGPLRDLMVQQQLEKRNGES